MHRIFSLTSALLRECRTAPIDFGLCGMPTDETWPGFFKLPGSDSFQMDDKYVCPLRKRFKKYELLFHIGLYD